MTRLASIRPATLPDFAFDHGAISVPDLEASIRWFEEVLGFDLLRRFRLEPAMANCAMLGRGDMLIELFEPDDGVPLPPERSEPNRDVRLHGHKHIAFKCPDLDGMIDWLDHKDADIALTIDAKFGRALFVRDNSGNLIEFVARPQTEAS